MTLSENRARIGDLVEPVTTWNPLCERSVQSFTYIDIASIDRETKTITEVSQVSCEKAPTRARQLVAKDDVLVSSVRPNLNSVSIVTPELDGATASTGFCVLRAQKRRLHPRYLFHWTISPWFVDDMTRQASGQSYPAVSDTIIKNSRIPLPPLEEQKRIAAVLDKADAIRRKRAEALRLTDDFLKSVFLDMFGTLFEQGSKATVKLLGELVVTERPITYGILMPGPETPGGVPYVRVVDIQAGRVKTDQVRRTSERIAKEYRRSALRRGDLLMSIRGHIGRLAFVPQELEGGNITQDTARIAIADERTAQYVRRAIESPYLQRWLLRHTRGVAVSGLNLGDLRMMPIPLPHATALKKYAALEDRHMPLRGNIETMLSESGRLFESLVQRAFLGGL